MTELVTTAARFWLVLAAAIVLGAAFVLFRSAAREREQSERLTALALIPPGPALLVTVDVQALARAGAKSPLLRGAGRLFGLDHSDCATKALMHATALALAVEGANDKPADQIANLGDLLRDGKAERLPDLALIATGDYDAKEIATCAEQAIVARGGKASRTTIGTFISIRDQNGAGEVAVRDAGPLVLSDGHYLRDILDASEGRPPPASEIERARDALHAELRRSFGKSAPVLATLTLPPGWLKAALPEDDVELSPLDQLRSIALRVEPSGSSYSFELMALLGNEAAASKLEGVTLELKAASASALERYVGGDVVGQLTPRREGATLRLGAHIERAKFEQLWLAPSGPSVPN